MTDTTTLKVTDTGSDVVRSLCYSCHLGGDHPCQCRDDLRSVTTNGGTIAVGPADVVSLLECLGNIMDPVDTASGISHLLEFDTIRPGEALGMRSAAAGLRNGVLRAVDALGADNVRAAAEAHAEAVEAVDEQWRRATDNGRYQAEWVGAPK